ncbi:hypothetical protein GTA08_BOTSDO01995 [Neofusicoccum parvum]|uniref:Uncharacterized protein n=1 Tax=Neofusicoccum parvum TaxID=310453 RepID=A0ACB5SPN3_9PEZI|nr:hypothetical protein GTA08_BOTSDO01995 [Neofusicoccum parvum]
MLSEHHHSPFGELDLALGYSNQHTWQLDFSIVKQPSTQGERTGGFSPSATPSSGTPVNSANSTVPIGTGATTGFPTPSANSTSPLSNTEGLRTGTETLPTLAPSSGSPVPSINSTLLSFPTASSSCVDTTVTLPAVTVTSVSTLIQVSTVTACASDCVSSSVLPTTTAEESLTNSQGNRIGSFSTTSTTSDVTTTTSTVTLPASSDTTTTSTVTVPDSSSSDTTTTSTITLTASSPPETTALPETTAEESLTNSQGNRIGSFSTTTTTTESTSTSTSTSVVATTTTARPNYGPPPPAPPYGRRDVDDANLLTNARFSSFNDDIEPASWLTRTASGSTFCVPASSGGGVDVISQEPGTTLSLRQDVLLEAGQTYGVVLEASQPDAAAACTVDVSVGGETVLSATPGEHVGAYSAVWTAAQDGGDESLTVTAGRCRGAEGENVVVSIKSVGLVKTERVEVRA